MDFPSSSFTPKRGPEPTREMTRPLLPLCSVAPVSPNEHLNLRAGDQRSLAHAIPLHKCWVPNHRLGDRIIHQLSRAAALTATGQEIVVALGAHARATHRFPPKLV